MVQTSVDKILEIKSHSHNSLIQNPKIQNLGQQCFRLFRSGTSYREKVEEIMEDNDIETNN